MCNFKIHDNLNRERDEKSSIFKWKDGENIFDWAKVKL